uniref:Uncharacterized protein n=1 Tax=Arundo donax TaxID=35708 RepID=A0A0A8XWY6_ARUDO
MNSSRMGADEPWHSLSCRLLVAPVLTSPRRLPHHQSVLPPCHLSSLHRKITRSTAATTQHYCMIPLANNLPASGGSISRSSISSSASTAWAGRPSCSSCCAGSTTSALSLRRIRRNYEAEVQPCHGWWRRWFDMDGKVRPSLPLDPARLET